VQLTSEGFLVEVGVDQHYEVLKELGDCHTALGHYDRARQCYEEAALLAPDKPGPAVGLGVIGLQTDNLDAADRAFGDALAIDPACTEAYSGRAMVCQHRGDHAGAFDLYLGCLDKDADNLVALLGLFQASCQMGSFAKVTRYLGVYLDRHPGDVPVLYCLATLQARDGRFQEAAEALDTILALEPDNAEAADLLKEIRRKQVGAEAVSP